MDHYSGSDTDEQLASAVQRGDTERFGELVSRYEAKLLRYGRRFLSESADIEDIVQDAFLRAYENIQSYDPGQPFSPWMYRIAHNAFVNRLRKASRSPIALPDFDTLLAHSAYEDPAPRERDQEDMKRLVEEGLQSLSPKYREALILYYLEELPYKEIAEVLQVPVGTVGIRLARAREALKKALPEQARTLYD